MAQSSKRFTNMVTRATTVFGQETDFITIPTSSFEFHWGSSLFLNELHTVDSSSGWIRSGHTYHDILAYCYVCWLAFSCHVVFTICFCQAVCFSEYPPLNDVSCVTWCLVIISPRSPYCTPQGEKPMQFWVTVRIGYRSIRDCDTWKYVERSARFSAFTRVGRGFKKLFCSWHTCSRGFHFITIRCWRIYLFQILFSWRPLTQQLARNFR